MMQPSAAPQRVVPTPGQLCSVRQRRFVVTEVKRQALPSTGRPPQHLVELQSVDEEGQGERLRVIWELELGILLFDRTTFPDPRRALADLGHLDDPAQHDALLHAVRWGAVASADHESLHAPFRSGITIEDYQLDPVARAVGMPRVSLLVADDVGLGKTIEAGLVVQELALRHRVRSVLVVCPAGLILQWRDQMRDRFGLEFRIVDSEAMRDLRRRRGLGVNPWTHFPRLITSIDFLKRPRPMRLLRDALPPEGEPAFPRRFDLLIVDEAHNVAPSGRGQYAVDSLRTQAIRTIAPHFEHKLFLSATPHNGYTESFGALLELLDDQRFHRGAPPSRVQLGAVMVRRLKKELPPDDLGNRRFPERILTAIPVDFTEAERRVHADLVAYGKLRAEHAAGDASARVACEFVLKLLKKRLFSSPAAFRITLEKHRQTLARPASAKRKVTRTPPGILARELAGLDEEEDDGSDELHDERELELLEVATGAGPDADPRGTALLDRMMAWAERASGRPDAKCEALLDFLERTVKRDGEWNDTRVLVFTEFRATQNWLQEQLVARGLGDEARLLLLFGGMDTETRESVKAAFQASPRDAAVRILLATDAASEGIDLQNHCATLVHVEIPWNPMRMEQRNGRVDRHGQRAARVDVLHFAARGFDATGHAGKEPGTLEGDLEFLARAARKVEQVREDLGNVGDVLATQVEEAMLGRRRALDDRAEAPRTKLARDALKVERHLREEVARLRDKLHESRADLDIHAETLRNVVEVGLALAGHAPLEKVRIETEDHPALDAFVVPALTGTWAPCLEGLRHPHTGEMRPIVFDHDQVRHRDDVVLAHLGHKLVQMCLHLLRAEVWMPETERKLARITARVVPSAAIDHPVLVAHARFVVLSKGGDRLHEELVVLGGELVGGKLERLDDEALQRALGVARKTEPRAVPAATLGRIAELWPQHEKVLAAEAEKLTKRRAAAIDRLLAARQKADEKRVRGILEELKGSLEKHLDSQDEPQLELFSSREREQLERNQQSIRARIEQIPAEIEREVRAVGERFADPEHRLFPVALTYLIPSSLAAGR